MPVKVVPRSVFACLLVGLIISVMLSVEARAQPSEVEIEKLSWVDVRDRLASGVTTILIPTGGTEQNGRHMVLGKHNLIVRETARRIALELGDALVAPVLAYVPEGAPGRQVGHMAYAGTISLPENVFEDVLESVALSFKTHGFRRIVFLGDSGGNQRAQARLAERLSNAWAVDGVAVLAASDYYSDNGGDDFLKAQGMTAAQIGTHAGVRDTSELMFVAPEAVNIDKAVPDGAGATGDARLSRPEWGRQLIEKKVAAAVAQIRAKSERNRARSEVKSGGLLNWIMSLVTG